jgi:DNA (cytosine-5)-methyltransferase 1
MPSRPIAVDLFAGAGGMSLGFEQAGFDVLASVEIDPVHCATHQFNFPFWSILCRSVTDITGEQIRQLSAIGDREIDVVFGGPPCQGVSLIGKRRLGDPRNELMLHFLRLVLELKPKFFVMENVPGLAIGEHQFLFQEIIERFQKKGYKVETNYQVINAANYGVPQNRKRLFLLGCQPDYPLPNYPQPITQPTLERKFSKDSSTFQLQKTPTVGEAIQDLPEVNNYPELCDRDWAIADYGKPSNYASQLRSFHLLNDDFSYQRNYNQSLLTSSFRTQHTPQSIQRFSETLPGKIEPTSRLYRLSLDGLCNTLRAGTPRNLGAYTAPRPIHPRTPRCITVREAARLHSYPDWFRFHITKWHGFRQIGNSVPPLLAKAIAQEIIKALGIQPTKPPVEQFLGEEKLLQFNFSQAAKNYEG